MELTAVTPSELKVGVVGAGHVGLATAAVLASWDFSTSVIESDPARVAALAEGRAPFYEPGLDDLIASQQERGTLHCGTALGDLANCDVIFICVNVPVVEGLADLSEVESVVDRLADFVVPGCVLVLKCTVPPGTTRRLGAQLAATRPDLQVVSCPEFLREGHGIEDVAHPARVVIGGDEPSACARVARVFEGCDAPILVTGSTSAELIKYGSNAFLATKVSFINELAHFCDLLDADVGEVAAGIGSDPRIGSAFLNAGLGFGGSCFPKDVRALEEAGAERGYRSWLLQACTEINEQQRRRFVTKISDALGGVLSGRRIAVLGLAFKPETDDLRQAPALDVIEALIAAGATVVATDPMAAAAAEELVAGTVVTDPYECARGADVVVLATEWTAYRDLDWARILGRMAGNVVVDGRNFLDGPALAALGFDYFSIGRPVLLGSGAGGSVRVET